MANDLMNYLIELCGQDEAQWAVLCAAAGLTMEEYRSLTAAAKRGTMLVN